MYSIFLCGESSTHFATHLATVCMATTHMATQATLILDNNELGKNTRPLTMT